MRGGIAGRLQGVVTKKEQDSSRSGGGGGVDDDDDEDDEDDGHSSHCLIKALKLFSIHCVHLKHVTCVSGYGNLTPKTDVGKLLTIFYALVGIPLMLLYMTNIGHILGSSFKYTYSKFCRRVRCRAGRREAGTTTHFAFFSCT